METFFYKVIENKILINIKIYKMAEGELRVRFKI